MVEYAIDYVCPVPSAQRALRSPTGWAGQTLSHLAPQVQQPVAVTADSPYVFPNARAIERSRYYFQFENGEQLAYWNSLFEPIAAGRYAGWERREPGTVPDRDADRRQCVGYPAVADRYLAADG